MTNRLEFSKDDNNKEEIHAELRSKFTSAFKNFELPPLMLIAKAFESKKDLNDLIDNFIENRKNQFPDCIEVGSINVSNQYPFKTCSIKYIELFLNEIKSNFGNIDFLSSEELATLRNKTIEFAWGWEDDYLILSIGKDSSHIKGYEMKIFEENGSTRSSQYFIFEDLR